MPWRPVGLPWGLCPLAKDSAPKRNRITSAQDNVCGVNVVGSSESNVRIRRANSRFDTLRTFLRLIFDQASFLRSREA